MLDQFGMMSRVPLCVLNNDPSVRYQRSTTTMVEMKVAEDDVVYTGRVYFDLFETFGNLVFGNKARLELAGHEGISSSNSVYQFVM